ncbi:hypothetical protein [Acinetobacter rongchengensis]|uniref:Uncharacterized protein n=1 Tax=Acinetobacter rongchengensis TaxID=2419601 RepID=A0A3A8F5S2_9GAMM|nr:hypothetical protein [Acinetobacter rongchengensis]RKG38450.1 hypothetical protein D7V20_07925 [Acinetobacter rongchengensis]
MENQAAKKSFFNQGLSTSAYLMCGWPFILVFVGGAIGGGLGALAYFINLKIYKSNLSNMYKVILNILTGMTAMILWYLIAISIAVYFQQ